MGFEVMRAQSTIDAEERARKAQEERQRQETEAREQEEARLGAMRAADAVQGRIEAEAKRRRDEARVERRRIETEAKAMAARLRREEQVRQHALEILRNEPGGIPSTFPRGGEDW